MRGTHAPFRILSNPDGAAVALSSGETCVTPCTLDLPRGTGFKVRLTKQGYVTTTVEVVSKGSGAGVVGLLSNGMIGGLVGASVDAGSGAMRSLSPNPLVVTLQAEAQVSDQAK